LRLAAGAEQDRRRVPDEQAPVQLRRLAGDQLRPQPRQEANVLVLPDEERVEPGRLELGASLRHPLLAKHVRVRTVFVIDAELAVREAAEVATGHAATCSW